MFSNYPERFLGSGWFKVSALRIKSSLPSQPDLSRDDVLTHLSHPESADSKLYSFSDKNHLESF